MPNPEITNEAFDEKVRELAKRHGIEYVLGIPGVWELVAEDLNNDAIKALEDEAEPDDPGHDAGMGQGGAGYNDAMFGA